MLGTMTAVPGPAPSSSRPRCSAAVPEASARAGGDLCLERVDVRTQGCDPAGAHRVQDVVLLDLGDIGLGQVNTRHQSPACSNSAVWRRIHVPAASWLFISSERTSSTLSMGTSTLLTSGLVVARRSSCAEKRSSLIFSPGRRPV